MSVAEKTNGAETAHDAEPTARSRRRSAREQVILDAARQIIAETSYNAMTMDDLAARAQVSKPTLYQYFPSKEAVAVRAIIGLMHESHEYLNAQDKNRPAIMRLQTFVEWVLSQRFSPFRTAFGVAKTALAPVVREHPDYLREFARMVAAVSAIVEQAKNENDLAHELSTRVVVQMVFSLLRDSEYDVLAASGECTPHEIVQTLSALFMCGIRYCAPHDDALSSKSEVLEFQRSAAFPSPARETVSHKTVKLAG